MADATLRKNRFGVYQIRFRYQERQYERSLHTQIKREADDRLGAIRTTIRHLKDGVLAVPDAVEPVAFILSGGKLKAEPAIPEVTKPNKPDKPLTLREAGEKYLASFPVNSKEAETLKTERIHLQHLCRLLVEKMRVRELTLDHIQGYVTHRSREKGLRGKVQYKTIKMELDTFRQIWHYLADSGEVNGCCPTLTKREGQRPKLAVKLPKEHAKESFKTWDEIQAILARGVTPQREAELWECLYLDGKQVAELLAYVKAKARHPWIFPLFAFAAFTGARISEMCRTLVEDVNFDATTVQLREKKKRKGMITFRKVPLAAPLVLALRKWLDGHPGGPLLFCKPAHIQKTHQPHIAITRALAEKHFKFTLKNSKWAKLHGWHLFRHSFASNLTASGEVNQAYIDQMMGHQTTQMRERYRHLFPHKMRSALDVLSKLYARSDDGAGVGVVGQ
jgi:integrase